MLHQPTSRLEARILITSLIVVHACELVNLPAVIDCIYSPWRKEGLVYYYPSFLNVEMVGQKS